jgi:hypothetical protein
MSWTPSDEPWAEYCRQLFPGHTKPGSAFESWKYASTAVNITSQLWEIRERVRRTYERVDGPPETWTLTHPVVLLWLPQCFSAACLRCEWVTRGSADPAVEAARARSHAVEAGDDPDAVARRRIHVAPRNGPADRPPPVRWA